VSTRRRPRQNQATRHARQSLAFRLLALYLLFVVPVLGVALLFDTQASRRLQADVSAADLSLAEAIALETDALLLKAQQAVEAFAQMPAVTEMDLAGMEEAFGTGAAARQDINLFYRLDADGTMIFHYPTGPGSTTGVDFSFRDYFQAALASDGPVFSKGRISPTTERPVATVVMPIRDAEGRFDGVVATNLELQRLTQTLVVIGQDPKRGVQVALLDAEGQIIAHSEPEDKLLLVMTTASNGFTAMPPSPLPDGVSSSSARRRLPSLPPAPSIGACCWPLPSLPWARPCSGGA
jgi:C4-dicarboxylate-specific signal transduction histidine kinase